jgi:citrate synthase
MTVAQPPSASETAKELAELRIGEQVLQLPIERATQGQPAVDISALLKDAHFTTLDYGYANTAPTKSSITFLDETPASCATGAT